jgi:hypothetical protein
MQEQSTIIQEEISMEPTPVAPAKKSSALLIIAAVIAAILSLCCCSPAIINILSPIPYTSSTSGIFGESTTTGTISASYGLVCVCAALIPWIVVVIIALLRRPKA